MPAGPISTAADIVPDPLDTAISLLHPHSGAYLTDGRLPVRTGSAHPTIAPYEMFPAADGQLFVAAGNDRQFHLLLQELDLEAVAGDPRFRHNRDRVANRAELRKILQSKINCRNAEELARTLLEKGVPVARVNDVGQALADPHVLHREMRLSLGSYEGVGIPIKLGRTPGTIKQQPRRRGEDTVSVLKGLGYHEKRILSLLEAGVVHASG